MKAWLIFTAAACLSAGAQAQSMAGMADMPGMAPAVAPPPSVEELGEIDFPTSCAPHSLKPMEHGVALLHSFGYAKAQIQFEAIAHDDPTCAMAHWGIAMTQYHQLWGHPEEAALKLGATEIGKARALSASASPREKAYIGALGAFYDPKDASYQLRADAYEKAMRALHSAYPADVDGAAFAALAIIAATPSQDAYIDRAHQALAILQPAFAAHPRHPGLAHYIIHTCDTPSLAQEGLPAARIYAAVAPASPHALHMPGHIFARLGLWDDDIRSNLASRAASQAAAAAGQPGAAHQMHADEFLIYAWLQTGEDAKAEALTADMSATGARMMAMPGIDDMKDDGHFFDNELRAVTALERHQWQKLGTMEPSPGTKPHETFLIAWGRGIAAGHLHDAKLAAEAVKQYDVSFEAVKKSSYADMAEGMGVQRNELLAWQAYAEDRPEDAIAVMRKAADQQDKLGQNEVDIPAREMLGDLLMLLHRPKEAIVAYRTALTLSPNRLNGLLSAGLAAEQAGLPDEARGYYDHAVQQTTGAKSGRPDLLRAARFAAMNPLAR